MSHKKQLSLYKIKNIVVDAIFILLVGVTILMFASKISTGKANIFGYRPFVVTSESMLPDYKVGTFLIAKVTDEYIVGKIYAYKNVIGITVVHRLIDITDEGYIFKGDNNDIPDKPVQKENIHYEIVHAINKGK